MELPLELVDAILVNVPGSTDLSRCSLVCKDWRALGQSRLFKSISLRKASKNPQLLEILRTSSHIPSAIRTIDLNFISLGVVWKYMDVEELGELVSEILYRVSSPRSLVLRGPTTDSRITWSELPLGLQSSITKFMGLGTLEEIEIDGWAFDVPIHQFFSMLATAPSLRRLRLRHGFSGFFSEDTPEDFSPPVLNLDLLDIRVDDHLDVDPQVTSDLPQLFQLDAGSKLDLRVWLNTAFWAFGNIGEFLTEHIAEQVQTLELTIGELSHFYDLRIFHLTSYLCA
jgi:hypothetical protein